MFKFTLEHQKRLDKHCQLWKEKILSNKNQITYEQAKEAVDYLYKFTGQVKSKI